MTARDLVVDSSRDVLYVVVSQVFAGADAGQGAGVAVVDPATGTVQSVVSLTGDPDVVAISDDDTYLYVGLHQARQIERLLLPSLAADITFSAGTDPYWGALHASALEVAPGAPHTIATMMSVDSVSPSGQGGVHVFDDAVERTHHVNGNGNFFDSIQWNADGTTLFAANSETTSFDFYVLSVNSSGATLVNDEWYTFSTIPDAIHFDASTNRIYSDDGTVLDSTGAAQGYFGARGPMVPDSEHGRALFIDPPVQNGLPLVAFDLARFSQVGDANLVGVSGTPTKLVRWGQDGLAFVTDDGHLYVLESQIVSGP